MFTGLVEEKGAIAAIEQVGQGMRLHIKAELVLDQLSLGDSVCVNGVCLTVVEKKDEHFSVDVVAETMRRTNLSQLTIGSFVNLERALRVDARLGGHFVQGHIDGVGQIISIEKREPGLWLQVRVPDHMQQFVVEKGSIALDGVSLTVAEVTGPIVSIALIPFTVESTTIGLKKVGDYLNIETDILAKYVHRFIRPNSNNENISYQRLTEWGYE